MIETGQGIIRMAMRPDSAPETVRYISDCVGRSLYNGREFYRSDFVIQCGLHGSGCANPLGDLKVNETNMHERVSNTRGTASIAHWDVPDCGNTEFFINLQNNAHLDTAYGGYCVFAEVKDSDEESFAVVDRIAAEVKSCKHTIITSMHLE